jgi:hypothetical protein
MREVAAIGAYMCTTKVSGRPLQLEDVCTLESDMVSGRDIHDAKPSQADLLVRCKELLPTMTDEDDKLRLIATYWLSADTRCVLNG